MVLFSVVVKNYFDVLVACLNLQQVDCFVYQYLNCIEFGAFLKLFHLKKHLVELALHLRN